MLTLDAPFHALWSRNSLSAGGFSVDDFAVDHANRAAICPGGYHRAIDRTGAATFKATCRGCPLRTHMPLVPGQLRRTDAIHESDNSATSNEFTLSCRDLGFR